MKTNNTPKAGSQSTDVQPPNLAGAQEFTGPGGTTATSQRPKGGTDLAPSSGVLLPRGPGGQAAPGV
jgi:hypothetical protein